MTYALPMMADATTEALLFSAFAWRGLHLESLQSCGRGPPPENAFGLAKEGNEGEEVEVRLGAKRQWSKSVLAKV